jgi:hypothetical protein
VKPSEEVETNSSLERVPAATPIIMSQILKPPRTPNEVQIRTIKKKRKQNPRESVESEGKEFRPVLQERRLI